MKLVVVPPHFSPDVAPTGVVWARIVEELAERGHSIEVVTSFPWYRSHQVEKGYDGRVVRYEDAPWGRITRVHPFPTSDKRNIPRRALSFAGFSLLAAVLGSRGDRADGVIAVSPPLSLGFTGWAIAKKRKSRLIFNLQDIFPDIAVELGAMRDRRLIRAAHRVERLSYDLADAITVLSDDLKENLCTKGVSPHKVTVVPNFVETDRIKPLPKGNTYRAEFGLGDKKVVMYAGNVGLSQSLHTVLDCAAALAYDDEVTFVINGQGAQRDELERRARGMTNVVFVDMQSPERLPEVLAAADIHVVPLKKGLARSSVPSKTFSIMAAARPVVASVDEGSEVARVVEGADAGITVSPEDAESLTKAIRRLLDAPNEAEAMGRNGRSFVEAWASPAAVAEAYESLIAGSGP